MRLVNLILLFFLLLAAEVRAELRPSPILVGKEVEVPAEHLIHLLPYFDLPHLLETVRTSRAATSSYLAQLEAVPVRYLTHPQEFEAAPQKPEWDRRLAEALSRYGRGANVRKDSPPEVKQVFEGMSWSPDGAGLEFRDKVPFSDEAKFNAHTKAFLRLVKMEEIENNPLEHMGKTQMHIHLSVLNKRDLTPIFELVNILSLMKFIENGKGELALTDVFGFNFDLHVKGLTKAVSKNRFELRNHFISPEEDIRYLRRLFSQPEAESRKELSAEIRKRLTPEAIALIGAHQIDGLLSILLTLNAQPGAGGSLPVDSPEVVKAIQRALSGSNSDYSLSRFLNRVNTRPRGIPEEARLSRLILEEVQQRFRTEPAFFKNNRSQLMHFRRHEQKHLPPSEWQLKFTSEQWAEKLIGEAIEDRYSRSGTMELIGALVEDNPGALARILDGLNDSRTAKRMLFVLPAPLLVRAPLKESVLRALQNLSNMDYHDFVSQHYFTLGLQPFTEPEIRSILRIALAGPDGALRHRAEEIMRVFRDRHSLAARIGLAWGGCWKSFAGLWRSGPNEQ